MRGIKEENELIVRAVHWAARASEQLQQAGSYPGHILEMFSDKLLVTMVRNNLDIKYCGIID